jgi:hypothetical protein
MLRCQQWNKTTGQGKRQEVSPKIELQWCPLGFAKDARNGLLCKRDETKAVLLTKSQPEE